MTKTEDEDDDSPAIYRHPTSRKLKKAKGDQTAAKGDVKEFGDGEEYESLGGPEAKGEDWDNLTTDGRGKPVDYWKKKKKKAERPMS
jgi:hypothetical protein